MSAAEKIRSDLAEASAAIGAARSLLDQGSVVDMTGMERRVEEICRAVDQIPEDQRPGLKGLMVGLIDELNTLAEKLAAQHQEISGQLRDSNHHQRAVSAYGDAESTPHGEKPKK